MKRKFYLLFTALLMMAASSAWADKVQIGDLYYQLNSDGTAWVVYPNAEEPSESNPSAYTGDITVPSTVDYGETTYRVTRLNYAAFRWSKITSITLSEGLEFLDFVCLQHCDNLKQTVLTIPNSVTTLGSNVISFDNKIKTVIIGTGVKSVGNGFAWSSAVTDVYINTTNVPSGDDYMFPSVTIHVNHDMVEKFKAASKWSGFSNYIGDADEASLNYKIGARIKGQSELSVGDIIVIQAASSSKFYNYFIQETSDHQYLWKQGFNNNCVWRVVNTGNSSYPYYFRNVVSGRYMGGTNAANTITNETAGDDGKFSVRVYNYYGSGGLETYNSGTSFPRGWDEYSVLFNNPGTGSGDWWFRNKDSDSSTGSLNNSGLYDYQWNIFKAEVDDDGSGSDYIPGTAISSISDIKPNVSYVLATKARGEIVYKENADNPIAISSSQQSQYSMVASTKAGFNQWVFRPAGNNTYYLYNVAAQKYIKHDSSDGNELTADEPDTVSIVQDGDYFKIVTPSTRTHFGIEGGKVYINGTLGDDGTRLQIIEAFDFDPSVFESTTVPSFTLVDKVDYTPPTYSFTATSATYTRDMKSGVKWGTVMLPYAVSATSDVKFYEITSLTNDELTVTETTNGLTAGTPALFKRTNTSSPTITFSATDAEVVPDVNDATSGTITLKGVYAADNITDAYYIANDKFWSGSFHIYPFRAYLTGSAGSNAFSILVDDDPTGITTAATTTDASDEIEGVYSVSGVKLSDLQKGINIIRYRSGKTQKVILK